jgi:hypothetical protein
MMVLWKAGQQKMVELLINENTTPCWLWDLWSITDAGSPFLSHTLSRHGVLYFLIEQRVGLFESLLKYT